MTDHRLFWLDEDRKWDLACDRLQWMIRRAGSIDKRSGKRNFTPKWFVGRKKRTLAEGFGPRGIQLTDEARHIMHQLPESFSVFQSRAYGTDGKFKGVEAALEAGHSAIAAVGGAEAQEGADVPMADKIIAYLRGSESIECPEHGIRLSHRVPIYTLCRRLNELGLGDKTLSVIAPSGTPSCKVNIAKGAGLTIGESDSGGLRLQKYRPFPVDGTGPTVRSPVSEGGSTREEDDALAAA